MAPASDSGEEQVAALLAKAEAADETWEQIALVGQAAAVVEDVLGDPLEATRLWRRALALDFGCVLALEALERIYAAQGCWSELAEVYEVRLDWESDAAERDRLLERLAALHEDVLGDPARAKEFRDLLG